MMDIALERVGALARGVCMYTLGVGREGGHGGACSCLMPPAARRCGLV